MGQTLTKNQVSELMRNLDGEFFCNDTVIVQQKIFGQYGDRWGTIAMFLDSDDAGHYLEQCEFGTYRVLPLDEEASNWTITNPVV